MTLVRALLPLSREPPFQVHSVSILCYAECAMRGAHRGNLRLLNLNTTQPGLRQRRQHGNDGQVHAMILALTLHHSVRATPGGQNCMPHESCVDWDHAFDMTLKMRFMFSSERLAWRRLI